MQSTHTHWACAGEEHRDGLLNCRRNPGGWVSTWVPPVRMPASPHHRRTNSLAHRRSGGIRLGHAGYSVGSVYPPESLSQRGRRGPGLCKHRSKMSQSSLSKEPPFPPRDPSAHQIIISITFVESMVPHHSRKQTKKVGSTEKQNDEHSQCTGARPHAKEHVGNTNHRNLTNSKTSAHQKCETCWTCTRSQHPRRVRLHSRARVQWDHYIAPLSTMTTISAVNGSFSSTQLLRHSSTCSVAAFASFCFPSFPKFFAASFTSSDKSRTEGHRNRSVIRSFKTFSIDHRCRTYVSQGPVNVIQLPIFTALFSTRHT